MPAGSPTVMPMRGCARLTAAWIPQPHATRTPAARIRPAAIAAPGRGSRSRPRSAQPPCLTPFAVRQLVAQAAFQAAAHARQLRRVQAEVLLLGHLDRHRLERLQPGRAAQRAAAGAVAAEHLGFVAHADLAHLDAHPEMRGQIAHQLAEVHARLRPCNRRSAASRRRGARRASASSAGRAPGSSAARPAAPPARAAAACSRVHDIVPRRAAHDDLRRVRRGSRRSDTCGGCASRCLRRVPLRPSPRPDRRAIGPSMRRDPAAGTTRAARRCELDADEDGMQIIQRFIASQSATIFGLALRSSASMRAVDRGKGAQRAIAVERRAQRLELRTAGPRWPACGRRLARAADPCHAGSTTAPAAAATARRGRRRRRPAPVRRRAAGADRWTTAAAWSTRAAASRASIASSALPSSARPTLPSAAAAAACASADDTRDRATRTRRRPRPPADRIAAAGSGIAPSAAARQGGRSRARRPRPAAAPRGS